MPRRPTREVRVDPEVARLVRLTRTPRDFRDLCDRMDLAPSKLDRLIRKARQQGLNVQVEHDTVGTALRQEEASNFRETRISPTVGRAQKVGVISDLHLGSKYCLREQIADFVNWAYDERGVREILCPGDLLEGDYRHAKFERSAEGVEDQTAELFQTLPQKRGLTYHCITGNHDVTFMKGSGVDVGTFVENYFRRRGRNDMFFYGDRSAKLEMRGAKIHLFHPGGSGSYALSYKLQNKISGYEPGHKPHVLLVGHYHKYCHVFTRGVHGFLCGTFQGGGSEFSKSLTDRTPVMMGGMIINWTVTQDGTLRDFGHEMRTYNEHEDLFVVENSGFRAEDQIQVQQNRDNYNLRVKREAPVLDPWY